MFAKKKMPTDPTQLRLRLDGTAAGHEVVYLAAFSVAVVVVVLRIVR
jgi:hypothetical protein